MESQANNRRLLSKPAVETVLSNYVSRLLCNRLNRGSLNRESEKQKAARIR